jgi:isocitrate dehydrogenase kinase/phosphatase
MSVSLALLGAQIIYQGFNSYHRLFHEVTRRASQRFDRRDWHGMQSDAVERLDLYGDTLRTAIGQTRQALGEEILNKSLWVQLKRIYSSLISNQEDMELAETFFNSITRRVFTTIGVNPVIEFVSSDFEAPPPELGDPVFRSYPWNGSTQALILQVLEDNPFQSGYKDIVQDARLAAKEINDYLKTIWGADTMESAEFIRPLFYRNKGAYIVGRARLGDKIIPLVLSLRHPEDGVWVDAVLMTEDEVSIVFSFTRSYFHVDSAHPHEIISFLKTILPHKRVAELYISIGYNRHGKTELYRDLIHHMQNSSDRFTSAPGQKGSVMLVFTLPSYDVVFKVIRDRFDEPKFTTRQDVMNRYNLVFRHDRAGRLVDAQEFEHLRFDRTRFSDDLLQELLELAPSMVMVDQDSVSIRHLYTERRLIPLDVYVRSENYEAAQEAVIEYGFALKDLAATNIFPGDVLLKNFGVTRHGRVVFYDYDELGLLVDYSFRSLPQGRDYDEDLEAEPWFYVGKNDIFPDEFRTFLGLQGELRDEFIRIHGDLFGVEFWQKMQERIRAGEVVDINPYKATKSLHRNELGGKG